MAYGSEDREKAESVEHVERKVLDSITNATTTLTDEEQRKTMRNVDRRVVIILGAIYCVNLMDRTNLGLAAVAGMRKDLHLVGTRYSIVALVFFPTYVLFQPVATVLLRKIGPRIFLSIICLCWGSTTIGLGFCKEWIQMVPLRLLLGILEAGSFPGGVYLLSCWYTRFELQRRNSYYYMIGMLSSAFAGILAYGITQMEGAAGVRGWRWIFIIEGIITCVIALVAYWVIVDFPEHATKSFRFLTQREVDFVVARIENDRKDAIPEPFALRSYLSNGLDWKVWAYALTFALAAIPTYGLSFFLPIILQDGLGYSVAKAQCLIAPPHAFSAVIIYIQAYLGDKHRIRGLWIAINCLLVLIGSPIIGYAKNEGVRLFGVFLCAGGAYAQVPAILTYQATNIRGQWRRAFCSASLIGTSGIGAIAGTLVFRSQDAPDYRPGLITLLSADALILAILAGLSLYMYRANKKADSGELVIEGLEDFRYTL